MVFGPLLNWLVFLILFFIAVQLQLSPSTPHYLLSFKFHLYILDNSPLSDVSFVNIFSQSVACLLSFGIAFCGAEVFNFNEIELINDFFPGLCF